MIRNVPHTETVKKKVFVKIGRPGTSDQARIRIGIMRRCSCIAAALLGK